MSQKPQWQNKEQLNQLSTKELVEIILAQQEIIAKLSQEIEKLTLSRNLDSKISSKPPSSDLLKKPEKETESSEKEGTRQKRKPGGQIGHTGTTRKGFGRIDRSQMLKAEKCLSCSQSLADAKSIKIERQSVAVLVERPIEVVEYQRHHIRCECCGKITAPEWSNQMIPGQELGIKLQGLLGWLGNYGHLPYEKQLKTRINLTLAEWSEKAGYEAGKLLRNLKLKADQWWYFLHHPEIPPDNNLAERALRLAVTKRKVSGGSRSMARFQETAHLLSVIQTCRFQGRSVMDFFAQALMATIGVIDRPSLIPQFDT